MSALEIYMSALNQDRVLALQAHCYGDRCREVGVRGDEVT